MLWAAIDPMDYPGKRLAELKTYFRPEQHKKALLFLRAATEAVCAGTLSFTEAFEEDYDDNHGAWTRKVAFPDLPAPDAVVAHRTRVKQAVFMLWAKSKNIPSYRQSLTQSKALQLPTTVQGEQNQGQPAPLLLPLPAFLDASHPCHSAELRAGAEVWDAVVSTGAHEKTKSVKEALYGALDAHPEYKGLSTEAKKRISTVCWSSFFGHRDRLFDCRLLLKGIGRQVAQFGVQPHAVVEAHDIVGDVCHGLGVVGVVALPDPLCLEA